MSPGARGGYELARERRRITVGEIVRTAMSVEQMCETAEKTHVLDDEKVGGDFAI
jgi:DNA-binding IscR family transcriptional regulator